MKYLTQPCGNCPFRTDQCFDLRPSRALEITALLERDGHFTCHKTTHKPSQEQAFCGGAIHWMEQNGIIGGNVMIRLADRLGLLPYPLPAAVNPVSSSRWQLARRRGETEEQTAARCVEELSEFFGYQLEEEELADGPRLLELYNQYAAAGARADAEDEDDDGDWDWAEEDEEE